MQANHKICNDLNECFGKLLKDKKRAVAISRAHAVNNPLAMIDNFDFFCFPVSNDVVIYSSVMMFRRHHPLILTMNDKIRAISESGLLSKWKKENTFVAENNDENDGSGRSKDGNGKQMKLRLDHVQGAFILLFIGVLLAAIAFIFELFAFRLLRRDFQNRRLLRLMEEFFCFA